MRKAGVAGLAGVKFEKKILKYRTLDVKEKEQLPLELASDESDTGEHEEDTVEEAEEGRSFF